jgi:hypothetical protein
MADFRNSAEFPPSPTDEGESAWVRRLRWSGNAAMKAGGCLLVVDGAVKSPVVGGVAVGIFLAGLYGRAIAAFAGGFPAKDSYN